MFLSAKGNDSEVAQVASDTLNSLMPMSGIHGRTGGQGLAADVRGQLADQGWYTLAVHESGDAGAYTVVDAALFYREVGRIAGPVDILNQCLAAAALHGTRAGDDVAAGKFSVALAVEGGSQRGATLRVIGGGERPDIVILVTRDRVRVLQTAATPTQPIAPLDAVTSMRWLQSDKVEVLRESDDARLWRFGQVATAAMLAGIAEATLDMIVQYAKVRETFGRPIGSYQAVRHPCADMALRVEAARCQLWYAAAALDERHADADIHLRAAKHLNNVAAVRNADSNIQLHGGIGVTDEHYAHFYLKHALLLSRLFGSSRTVLQQLVPNS